MVKLLKREITVMRKVKSDFTIKFLGSEVIGTEFCIYMEYMGSGSLQSQYQKYGCCSDEQLKVYVAQILKGLIDIHEAKIIHCDLKCANILLQKKEDDSL